MNFFRSSLFFPLSLALLLGGLSAWLEQISEISYEENTLASDEPQYKMQSLLGIRYDETGTLKEKLAAHSAWQLPDQKNVFFRQPEFWVKNQNHENGKTQNNIYQIHANDAVFHLQNKTIAFENQVTLIHLDEHQTQTGSLHTEYLWLDTQNETIQTDRPVLIKRGLSEVRADGLLYEYKTGMLNLPSQVKAVIYADPKH